MQTRISYIYIRTSAFEGSSRVSYLLIGGGKERCPVPGEMRNVGTPTAMNADPLFEGDLKGK